MALGQSTTQFTIERDLHTAHEMASRLKPYVYEPELYGLMPGDLPRLTVGGLLMRIARLSALSLSPAQQSTLDTIKKQLETIRKEWLVAYEGKIQREVKARIMSMNQFLDECADNAQNCADLYVSGVEKRVMLEALKDDAEALNFFSPEMKAGIAGTDNKIHRFFAKSDQFIWNPLLQPAYPREKFWYLYTTPSR